MKCLVPLLYIIYVYQRNRFHAKRRTWKWSRSMPYSSDLRVSPSGIIGFVFRNRSLFITSGEVGVGVQMIFVVTTEHLHVPPLFFLCVFFDPAIRWWKISWLPSPSSLKATTKNQCYYLLPNPHVDRLKVYNTNLLFVVTIYGFKRYLQKKSNEYAGS